MTHIKHTLINKKHVECSYFDHLVHISDIHVRPLERHNEYSLVFQRLNDYVKKELKNKKLAVAITGDVFDNKTVFKPETFYVVKKFIKDLAQQCPVFVINGNHDMLESNTRRMDALTPTVSDIKNVHYFSLSGTYTVNEDYLFSVVSLQDTTESTIKDTIQCIRNEAKEQTGRKIIGMYHGTLQNVLKIEVEKKLLSISDFDYCDITLLGDIHKRQTLEPYIGYAGSLIQQNHGESITGHGGLLWDIKNKQAKPFDIKNDYSFVDIVCTNGVWSNSHTSLTPNIYARFLIDSETNEYQVTEITKELEQRVNNCILTTKVYSKQPQSTDEKENKITSKNEEEMIKKECEILKLNNEVILSIHNMYKQEALLNDDNTYSSSVWKPERMEFKNLFGFNKSRVQNIDFAHGIHSIQAANGVGKTSIINALLFGIYGKTPLVPFGRGVTYDIINNCETEGYVHVYFLFNNVRYIIKRYNKKNRQRNNNFINSKLQSYTFYVDLYKCGNSYEEDHEKVSETGNATDEVLLKMFGDIEYFLHSNMLDKEASKDIITSTTQSERLRILKKIFHLEYYDDYKQLNAKNMKNIKAQRDARINEIKGVEAIYQQEDEAYLQEQIINEKAQLSEANSELHDLEERQEKHQARLTTINNMIELNLIKLKDAPNVNASKENLEALSNELRSRVQPNQQPNSVEWYQSQMSSLEALNSEYEKHILPEEEYLKIDTIQEEINKNYKEEEKDIDNLKEQYYTLKTDFKETKKQYEKYKETIHIENDLTKEEINDELKQVTSQRNAILMKNTSTRSRKQLETELYYMNEQAKHYQVSIEQETETRKNIQDLKVEIELLKRETKDTQDQGLALVNLEKIKSTIERKLKLIGTIDHIPPKIEVTEEMLHQYENTSSIIDECNNQIEAILSNNYKEEATHLLDIIDTYPYKKVSSSYISEEHDTVFKRIERSVVERINDLLTAIKEETINKEHLDEKYAILNTNKALIASYTEAVQNNEQHESLVVQKEKQNKLEEELEEINKQIMLHNIRELRQELKHQEQTLGRIEHLKKIDELKEQIKQHKSSSEIQNDLNDLDEYITELEEHLNYIYYQEAKENYEKEEKELKSLKEEIEIQKQIKQYKKLVTKLNQLKISKGYYEKYNENLEKIKTHQDELLKQKEYEDYIKLTAKVTVIELIIQNNELINEREAMLQDKQSLRYKDLQITVNNLNNSLIINTEKLKNYSKASEKIKQTIQEIKDIETHLKMLEDYDKLISNKGLPSKILYDIIKSIEYYINSVITSFLDYQLQFLFDYEKQYLEILCLNTKTEKMLSFQRLSGYEKCVVRIALKRAINKFSCNSKSSIIVIDEAFDCIDEDNFIKRLPQLISLISADYDLALIVSQRDISHVADKVIKIKNNLIS